MKLTRRGIAAFIVIGVVFVSLCGAFGPNTLPEVRTRRVTIVDEFGREVGFLAGANGQARLELRNLATQGLAVVAAEAETSVILGTTDKNRVRLFNKGELSALEVRDDKGKLRVLLGISEKGKPKIILRGAEDDVIWQAPPDEPQPPEEPKEKEKQGKEQKPDSL